MNELIYKQDAKDAVDMALDTIDHVPEWVYDILLNSLDKLPSAQPGHLVKESSDLVKELVNDCINRQDAVKTMYDACEDIDDESLHIDVIVDALENLPSAEPEIIRCRDCKHHDGIRCFRWNSTIITGFDDFCSNAERRSEEE